MNLQSVFYIASVGALVPITANYIPVWLGIAWILLVAIFLLEIKLESLNNPTLIAILREGLEDAELRVKLKTKLKEEIACEEKKDTAYQLVTVLFDTIEYLDGGANKIEQVRAVCEDDETRAAASLGGIVSPKNEIGAILKHAVMQEVQKIQSERKIDHYERYQVVLQEMLDKSVV